MTFLTSAMVASAEPPRSHSGVILQNMDPSVSPRADLFDYANGGWLRTVPIPADRSSYGVQQIMIDQSRSRLRAIAEAARTAGDPEARKVGALYASFMDESRIERAGIRPLQPELARIDAISNRHELASIMGRLDRIGMIVPISTYVAPDARDAQHYALWLSQNDLGLPGKDYYLSDGATYVDKRAKYRAHVEAMLSLAGDVAAPRHADAILSLETAIARLQWIPVDRRDPDKTYNPKLLAELNLLAPRFDWVAYFAASSLPPAASARSIARQPDYLAGVAGLTETVPLETWKAYFRYLLIAGTARYLPARFAAEDFAFNEAVLRGTKAQAERWKRGCELIDRLLGEATGKLYVARYFSPQAKANADLLVDNLFAAYRDHIQALDWMDPATKVQALAKLAAMNVKIGYPKGWRDYSALTIRPDDLIGNILRAQQFDYDRQHRRVGALVDREEWQMTVSTPDAYYSPQTNEIAFPAAILQPPLFDPEADDAFNYGSTGATIGHEMSHGFDNRGSRFDAAGNLRDWWTPADHVRYAARTALLVRQFDGFEPLPGEHVDGRLVLSENIADLAGLSIAWQAYLRTLQGRTPPVIDGLTGAQRFFLGYAQSYMGKRRDEAMLSLIKTNPHPPERYRVNGIVVHLPAFYAAFAVKPGDPMFLAEDQRAAIW
ncbi:M13 family metallopeptidase [Sphingobium sp. BYY-5]|uniref:M13 family metallopeptidase n=1 Tax=Sphingobium sp. BYY-5 TaxID=2926400 RepID=UPI001FA7E418|nr:M13 family metallopeptidase [Sphingobium sp. BYY-5]MCI4592051.1 M13 family metallopeptidase [Sphingobium sp. BYY-5]